METSFVSFTSSVLIQKFETHETIFLVQINCD